MILKRNKGFTLVEVLLAVLILSGAIGGALLLYVSSMVSSQLAWDTTVATSHAEYVLEEMQTRESLDDILTVNWKGWATGQGLDTLPDEGMDIMFGDAKANPLDIQVRVDWVRKSRANHIILKTKITK